MYKSIVLFLSLFLAVTLAACGGDEPIVDVDLNTDLTDQLTLDRSYAGTTLEQDGIEEVTLISCEDGDTAVFDSTKGVIRVRFLGIDTPEASYKYDPWGLQATNYVCDKLYNASTFVIEIDDQAGPVDNYGRTLGYVWYDGRLVNLEVIEQAYSFAVGVEKLKYGEQMLSAQEHARLTEQRIHGEVDPLYDYSTSGTDMSIEELVKNYEDYILKSVNVEGVITRKLGTHVFIEQDGYGLFVYTGHESSAKLVVGNEVRFEKMQVSYDLRRQGGLHLARFNVRTVSVLSENNPIEADIKQVNEVNQDDYGRFLRFEDLVITNIAYYMDTWTLVVTQNGQEMIIHQPVGVFKEHQFEVESFIVGQTLVVQGILQETIDGYHLLVLDSNDVTIDE